MADLERTIKVLLFGEDVNLDKAMANASRDFDKFTGNVQSATEPLMEFGKKVAMTEAALVAMVGAGIVYAYDKAKTLESAMIDLEKVVGNQPELLDMAKQAAYELGDTYGESTSTIVQSIADFKQAGFTVEESIGLVKNSLDLMIAGEVEAAASSEYLVRILKGFGEGAGEAGRAVDILNEISNEYATDVGKLAEGLAGIAPIASAAGISMEQAAGLITPIIEVFQSGDEAARALRTGLLRLAEPTPKIEAALKDLGVAVEDSNGAQRSSYDILLDVAGAYEGLTKEQKLTFASIIGGKNQAAKLSTVFDNLAGVTGTTAAAMNSAGSAMAEVERRLESSEVAVNRFFNVVENVFAKAGDKYIDSATGMINASTEIGRALQGTIDDGAFDQILGAIDGFFVDIEEKLLVIAKNLPGALEGLDFSGLIDSFETLGGEVGDSIEAILGGNIDLSTMEGLEDALQRLVNLFEGTTNFTAGFLDGLQPMLRVIGELGQEAGEAGAKAQQLMGKISGLAQTTKTAFETLDTFKGVFVTLFGISQINNVVSFAKGLQKVATASNSVIGVAGKAGLLGMSAAAGWAVGGLINDYIPGVKSATQAIYGWIDSLVDFTDTQKYAEDSTEGLNKVTQAYIDNIHKFDDDLSDLRTELAGLGHDVDGMSREMVLQVSADEGILEFDRLRDIGKTRRDEIEDPIKPSVDPASTDKILSDLEKLQTGFGDIEAETRRLWEEQGLDTSILKFDATVEVDADTEKADKQIKETKEKAEQQKIELEAELEKELINKDIAALKADADTLQTAMEWKAKLDMAEVEAGMKMFEATMETIPESVKSTGNVITNLFDQLADDRTNIRMIDALEQERQNRDELLKLQQDALRLQNQLAEKRLESMEDGDAMVNITIDDSVEPALKLVMMNIIELMQTEFNQMANQFLIGVDSV